MTKKRMIYLAIAFLVVIVGSVTWSFTARAAYESAEYTVVESDGDFEIRDYPDLMLASTAMKSESQGNDGSFMRRFRYIGGANATEQKVAMTTPVFMQDAPLAVGKKLCTWHALLQRSSPMRWQCNRSVPSGKKLRRKYVKLPLDNDS